MGSRASSAFNLKTLLVVAGCLAGAAAGAFMLYRDYNLAGSAGVGDPLAKIERRQDKVRRKPGNSFKWSSVQESENLYKKDSVQTGTGSAVSIRMNDGSVLELGEDSLVVIDSLENLALNFQKGSLVVRTAKGDSKVSVGKNGKVTIEELPVRLVKPDPLTQFFVPEKTTKPIRFAWEPRQLKDPSSQKLPDAFVVQVSPDRAFKPERTQSVVAEGAGGASEITSQIKPGKYFWRVVAQEDKKVLTEIAQFRVTEGFALKPSWPGAGEKVVVFGEDNPVQFRWSRPPGLSGDGDDKRISHHLEVARDEAFSQVVVTEEIAAGGGVATIKKIPEGAYFWRIRGQYPDLMVPSRVERFALEKAKKVLVDLGKPDEAQAFEVQPQVRFNWSADAPEAEFLFELKGKDGKTLVSQKSNATAFAWKDVNEGVYQWRVSALFKGNSVGESAWRKFSVFKGRPLALKTPENGKEILYWEEPVEFRLAWDADPLLAEQPEFQYQLELSREADFKTRLGGVQTRQPSVASAQLKLGAPTPAVPLFWRVKVVDGSGLAIKTSPAQRFTYGVHPPLRAPASTSADAPRTFNVIEMETDPVVTWAPVEGAEGYEVTVKLGEKTVLTKVTAETRLEMKGLVEGKYSFMLRTIDRLKRRGDPALKGFTVTYGEPLGAPDSLTPEVQ